MINSIRRRGRRSRFVALSVVACMTGAGLGLIATPASAANPPANFLPDDDDTNTSHSNILSDRFDGTDQLAHLTAVATADTDRYEWYVCDVGVGPTVSNTELATSCDPIGTDSSPNSPTGGTLLNPADEAYEFGWDIPTILDTQVRHIAGLACVGAGTNVDAPNPNCRQDVEQNVRLDDAAGGTTGQTSSGEIVSICTAGPALCEIGATTPGSAARAAIDARFSPLIHGEAVPNDGFTVRFTTSPDFAAANLCLDLDFGADANQDPDFVDTSACTPALVEARPTFKIWQATYTDGQILDGQEFAMYIEDLSGGEGFCSDDNDPPAGDPAGPAPYGDCTLDSHYHASVARAATAIVQSWTGTGGGGGAHTHTPPSPTQPAGCESGETAQKSHSNTSLAATEQGEACVTDQFGDPGPGATNVTEEISGPGTFTACPGGTLHDHDSNGSNEHCHQPSGGTTTFTVANFGATTGTVTVVSCVENQPTSGAAGHGCANESVKDTLTLSYATTPTQVFLAFAGTGTNASDPCRTGATIANGVVGQRESLVVCTFDSNGNPVGTDVDATRLQWTIVGAHGNDAPSVRFVGSPPTETTGNGQATLEIEDIGPGDNFVTVTLLNANGNFADDFFIEKDVAAGGGNNAACEKAKKRVKRLKKKLRKAIANDADKSKIRRLRNRLRRAKARRARLCR